MALEKEREGKKGEINRLGKKKKTSRKISRRMGIIEKKNAKGIFPGPKI